MIFNQAIAARVALTLLLGCVWHPTLAETDTNRVKFNLGVVEAWRAKPEAIVKWCERIDPEGIVNRNAAYKAWFATFASTIEQASKEFETVVPVVILSANPQIDVVKGTQAVIKVNVLKMTFLGKTDGEAKAICQAFVPDTSPGMMEKVTKALDEIARWREENNVSLR